MHDTGSVDDEELSRDMGYIDFHSVAVGNLTAAWLIPVLPAGGDQWFPNTPPHVSNIVIWTIKDQYSGITYEAQLNVDVVAPQFANWSQCTPAALILTIYTPPERRSLEEDVVAPTVIEFKPSQ